MLNSYSFYVSEPIYWKKLNTNWLPYMLNNDLTLLILFTCHFNPEFYIYSGFNVLTWKFYKM